MIRLNRVFALVLAIGGMSVGIRADDYLLTPRRTGNAGYQYHPSPSDWRNENMYQLFTDRFSDGNSANNNVRGWYTTTGYRHYAMGGDWKGVRNKLDYLQGMGVTAIWISGVQINEQGTDTRYAPYHAYHPTDFYRVEPMFGTFQELKDLIDDAHGRGMYIILDVVINHMADLNGLGNGNDDFYHPWGGGNLFWWNGNKKHAWPLDNLAYFHNNGKIVNWSDSGQILNGAFVGTDDLKTEDTFVQNHLLAAFKNLIEATDCDGFRVDAIKHVEKPFLMSWADTMRKHAAWLGKSNFILFGENFTYDDNAVAEHCKDQGYAFNSALYFPMQLTLKEVFAWEQPTRKLQDRLNNLHLYGEGAQNLVTFMDNHDVDRISLEAGDAWQTKLKPALTFLYTGTPVPCLFYGTEHGFNQGGTRNNGLIDGDYQRECMMNYGYQPGNAWGDKFTASELYNYVKKLNELRKQYPALTRGTMVNRWKDDGNKGLFAYTRTLGDQEALVVFNTDWSAKSLSPVVGKPDGTVYVNLLDTNEVVTVSGGKLNNINVGSKGSKIFHSGSNMSEVRTTCTRSAITITYKANKGPLENAVSNIVLAIRHDGASNAVDYIMVKNGDVYSHAEPMTNSTNSITFWFRDQKSPPIYDNNGGSNWMVVTKDCWKTGVNLAFVGNISHWPVAGEIDPGEDVWVDIQTWPKRAAFDGKVVYSADGGTTWFTEPVVANGDAGNNDGWHANLGSFPRGVSVQYAVMMEGENGEVWNNNGTSNHWFTVNTDVVPVTWAGNTHHWPFNGDLDSTDDLWMNIESRPIGAGYSAAVVYSIDGGSNWSSRALKRNGTTTDSDRWHLNLGRFPAGVTITYALVVGGELGQMVWDNNSSSNFTAVVNPSSSSVQWFGNTTHFSAPQPQLYIEDYPDNRSLVMMDLRRDVVYSICWSSNLTDWVETKQYYSMYNWYAMNIASNGSIDASGFYSARIVRGIPGNVVAGEPMVITIETHPVGGAAAANLVYSADGGSTWNASPMTKVGQKDANDVWNAQVGVHPSGTVIKYAVEVKDGTASSFWDNNGSQDYQTTVVP